MAAPEALVDFPDEDPARRYTADQERRIAIQLDEETLRVAIGDYASRGIDLGLLVEWHRNVFGGVKPHAGVHRRDGRGTATLIVFEKRAPREAVEPALDAMFSKLRRGLTQLLDNSDDPGYEEAAFHWAAWAHVQVVSIQPFEDGNKRTGRLLMSHILTTLGFDALTFEHCRSEYMDALKEALDSGDVGLLRDLAIRTYVESL